MFEEKSMNLSRISTLLSVTCLLISMSGAVAMRAQSDASGPASQMDKHFVTEALRGGMAEVALGRMAAEKGGSDDVKQFGQKMVADHTELGEQMKGVAAQIGVEPPTMLPPADLALETKLKALSGEAFDQAYIRAMVKDHESDLAAFNEEVTSGTSAAVTGAAAQGAKVVQEHLNMIRKIAEMHHVDLNAEPSRSDPGGH
jgi:putative membrane protein